MKDRIDLACTACGREFVVLSEELETRAGRLPCPSCGCTDLALIVYVEGVACYVDALAAV